MKKSNTERDADASFTGDGFKTAHELFVENCESQGICPHCGGAISIRNPTGKCDHLKYLEYITKK